MPQCIKSMGMSQCIAISTGYAGIPILTLNHSWRGTLNRTDTPAFSQPALNHDITMPDQWLQSLKETNQLLVIQDNIIACKKLVNHCWFHYKNQSKRDWNFVIPLKFFDRFSINFKVINIDYQSISGTR